MKYLRSHAIGVEVYKIIIEGFDYQDYQALITFKCCLFGLSG